MGRLDPQRNYPASTLNRHAELMLMANRVEDNVWPPPLFTGRVFYSRTRNQSTEAVKARFPLESFLAALEKAGLLEKAGIYWRTLNEGAGRSFRSAAPGFTVQSNTESTNEKEPKPVIVMDTASSFIIYPEINFADAVTLAAFCSIKELCGKGQEGTALSFLLTRDSVVRGFDQGMDADAMMALLDRLSGGRLDSNLGWTLKEWENRYSGVSLNQGIVLTLAEENRYLAEAKTVSSLIKRTLAPGVYLLSCGERSEAAAVLRKAGVDIVAQPPLSSESESGFSGMASRAFSRSSFPRLDANSFSYRESSASQKAGEVPKDFKEPLENAASIQEKFRNMLEKMKLTKQERDELLARIERRLVLSEAQLEATSLRYEKLEARLLDYAGKAAIAKHAIESGSLVEVTWPVPGGEQNCVIGVLQALEKKEGESTLVLRVGGDSETDPKILRISLGKVSLLRRIKQSIFGE